MGGGRLKGRLPSDRDGLSYRGSLLQSSPQLPPYHLATAQSVLAIDTVGRADDQRPARRRIVLVGTGSG